MNENTLTRYNLVLKDYKKLRGKVSLTNLCKQHNCDRGEISLFLKSKGVRVINYHNITKFSEHVFDIIDTEQKAYWLGFLFADGAVGLGVKNYLELSLKPSDYIHLEKFKKFLKAKASIRVTDVRCRFSVSNKYFSEVLTAHGCTPRKSLTLKFPTTVSASLMKHFLRGYFDGDGSIFETYAWNRKGDKKTKPFLVISLLGTKEFLKEADSYLNFRGELYTKNKIKNINTWFKSETRIHAFKILDYMYKDSKIYLDRKYKLYLKFKKLYDRP